MPPGCACWRLGLWAPTAPLGIFRALPAASVWQHKSTDRLCHSSCFPLSMISAPLRGVGPPRVTWGSALRLVLADQGPPAGGPVLPAVHRPVNIHHGRSGGEGRLLSLI